MLSAGPTPQTPLPEWTFSITQGGDTLKSWTWQEMRALPAETVTADIHCVTRWSKLGTQWRGVPVDTLLDQVAAEARYVLAFCDGGYTTNLLYSSRTLPDVIYRGELDHYRDGVQVICTLTRSQPPGWTGYSGRVNAAMLAETVWSASQHPLAFVCGPSTFVEAVAENLIGLGYPPERIKAERFGGT